MNYFKDLYPNYSNENFNRKLSNEVDGKSRTLIDNMKIFLSNQFVKYNINFRKCDVEIAYETFVLNLDGTRLTCDYLGPSTYYATNKISNHDILKYVILTREFGGHMIWPSLQTGIGRFDKYGKEISKSINTARSYCLRERLDYTLFEIRQWYLNKQIEGTTIFQKVLDANKSWFDRFGNGEEGYKTFIEAFVFQDSVDPNSLEPYDFESYNGTEYEKLVQKKRFNANDYIPEEQVTYKKYIKGTVNALLKRDERIKKTNILFQSF